MGERFNNVLFNVSSGGVISAMIEGLILAIIYVRCNNSGVKRFNASS
jgi:hypothetical protein